MSHLPDDGEMKSDLLAKRIMDALQDGINAGEAGSAKMITSFLVTAEVLDESGSSRIIILASDSRLTINLGLNTYTALYLGASHA